jgi:Replication-relaxation
LREVRPDRSAAEVVEVLPASVNVQLGCKSMTAGTIPALQEHIHEHGYRLLWWETGAAYKRRYRDHDHYLRPDAFAAYQAGEQRIRCWLEWDRATMDVRDLGVKLSTYA